MARIARSKTSVRNRQPDNAADVARLTELAQNLVGKLRQDLEKVGQDGASDMAKRHANIGAYMKEAESQPEEIVAGGAKLVETLKAKGKNMSGSLSKEAEAWNKATAESAKGMSTGLKKGTEHHVRQLKEHLLTSTGQGI